MSENDLLKRVAEKQFEQLDIDLNFTERWSNKSSELAFQNAATLLWDKGLSKEDALELLGRCYEAAINEYKRKYVDI